MRYFAAAFLLLPALYLLLANSVFAQSPKLRILSPAEDEVVSGESLIVRFAVTDFKFVDFRKTDLSRKNEGHLHIWLDEKNQTRENAIKHGTQEPYLLTNLTPGDHNLTLELAQSDHSSFAPKISQTVNFKAFGGQLGPTPTPTKSSKTTNFGQIAAGLVIGIGAISFLFWFFVRAKK